MSEKLYISWEDFQRDTQALSDKLHAKSLSLKGIVVVARGGLIPGGILAHNLNLRLIDTVCIVSYDHEDQQQDLSLLKTIEGDGTGWLVVDDLVDTGKTTKTLRDMLPQAHFSVVYAKPEGAPMVDDYVRLIPQETWIVFPWEARI